MSGGARADVRFKLNPRPYYQGVAVFERLLMRGQAPPAPNWRIPAGLTILGYHRVGPERDVLAVRPDRFRRQLELVLDRGGQFVSLADGVATLETPADEARVALTFDDGYLDNLETALPILEDLGAPATIYLVSSIADGREGFHWYRGAQPAAIRWQDARAVAEHPLVSFEAHGVSHLRLTALGDDAVRNEIAEAKREIEEQLGTVVTSFCYAAGLYGEREVQAARDAGYRNAVTTTAGVNAAEADVLRLRRLMLSWADDDRRFALKLAGGTLTESGLARWARRRRRRQAA